MPSSRVATRAKPYRKDGRLFTKKLVFVPRIPELLALEGYYERKPENPLMEEYGLYQGSGGRMSFSKWLIKNKGIGDPSKICKEVAEASQRFKLTCRYNDILRMSETKSFDACTQPGRFGAMGVRAACQNPNFAMLVIAGPSGHFVGRIGFVLKDRKVVLFRAYGTFSIRTARKFFEGLRYEVGEHMLDIASDLPGMT